MRHGPRLWKDVKALLMGLPSILRVLSSLLQAVQSSSRLCRLHEALQSHHTHVVGQSGCGCGGLRSGAVSGCVGDAGRADSIWDSVAVAGVKEKHTDA